tara:strand:- start:12275 stop:12880 length:606 start_codon:yes stop_codon:yes gene_type:complete
MRRIDMFTGIVQGTGFVQSIQGDSIVTIEIKIPSTEGLEIGGSVSIDGVCLTATSVGKTVKFDVIPETLDRTTLGYLKSGSMVNVERALKFGDELGGHLLSGHIMGIGEITSVENQDYTIKCPSEMGEYIQEKGYIAVDGISLTVGETDGEGCFAVHIIPETLRLTTLSSKSVGAHVNIEIDAMTQAVVETTKRLMENRGA